MKAAPNTALQRRLRVWKPPSRFLMKAFGRIGITEASGLQFPDQARKSREKQRPVGTQTKTRRFRRSGGFSNERWKQRVLRGGYSLCLSGKTDR